jgi:UDP-glucose 4-epimerase
VFVPLLTTLPEWRRATEIGRIPAMRLLVTGGAGFIGSHLVEAALARGAAVAVLDDLSTGRQENVPEGARFDWVDVRDRPAVGAVFREFRPTHVAHLAAQSSVKASTDDPVLDAAVNICGGLNVLLEAAAAGVDKLIFSSTGGALYGEVPEGARAQESWPMQPKSPYAASKAAFEGYLDLLRPTFGLRTTTLRFANVYGPRQDPHGEAGVVAIFAGRVLAGEPLKLFARREVGDAGCVRDYVHVSDVVDAAFFALENVAPGAWNVASGTGRTTQDVLDAVVAAAGRPANASHAGTRPGDLEVSVLDPGKLEGTGWRARVGFAEGIAETVRSFAARVRA